MTENILREKDTPNKEGTKQFAKDIVAKFHVRDTILFYGDIGSGKTFLIKELVKLLGLKNEVSSPSFSIYNQYSGSILVNHIDLYRIPDHKALTNLGLEDIWEMNSINFIEWPNLIEKQINWPHFRLYIETNFQNANWRKFKLVLFSN